MQAHLAGISKHTLRVLQNPRDLHWSRDWMHSTAQHSKPWHHSMQNRRVKIMALGNRPALTQLFPSAGSRCIHTMLAETPS
jgi:hypothetical protein